MDQLKSAYQLDQRLKFWYYLHLFLDLFDVALVNSFIVHKKLENKYLTLKELRYVHSIETDHFLHQLKTILSEPLFIQTHQSSKTWLNTSVTFANFLGDKTTMYCMLPSRKREQNICYVFIRWCNPLPSKRNCFLQYYS